MGQDWVRVFGVIIGFSLAGFRAFGVIKGLVQGVSGLLGKYEICIRFGSGLGSGSWV